MRDIRPIPTRGDFPKRAFDKKRPERPVRETARDGGDGRGEAPSASSEQRMDGPEALDVRV